MFILIFIYNLLLINKYYYLIKDVIKFILFVLSDFQFSDISKKNENYIYKAKKIW